jgi:hypothetical protein
MIPSFPIPGICQCCSTGSTGTSGHTEQKCRCSQPKGRTKREKRTRLSGYLKINISRSQLYLSNELRQTPQSSGTLYDIRDHHGSTTTQPTPTSSQIDCERAISCLCRQYSWLMILLRTLDSLITACGRHGPHAAAVVADGETLLIRPSSLAALRTNALTIAQSLVISIVRLPPTLRMRLQTRSCEEYSTTARFPMLISAPPESCTEQ